MAGSYPDVPAPRMAYDRDGTVATRVKEATSETVIFSNAEMRRSNNESTDGWNIYAKASSGPNEVVSGVLIFPEFRDIHGIWWGVSQAGVSSITFQTSVNTTNGFDGTWISQGAPAFTTINAASARNSISSYTLSGIKAVKLQGNYRGSGGGSSLALGLHIYGVISSVELTDRLRMWHPTLDEPLDEPNPTDGAYLDWGDVAQGTSQDRAFRIKNNSPTLTANSIIVSTDVLSNTSPTIESQITYSNGGLFTGSLDIGSLAPGATSPVITVRRSTSISAVLSIWSWRTVTEAGSWS